MAAVTAAPPRPLWPRRPAGGGGGDDGSSSGPPPLGRSRMRTSLRATPAALIAAALTAAAVAASALAAALAAAGLAAPPGGGRLAAAAPAAARWVGLTRRPRPPHRASLSGRRFFENPFEKSLNPDFWKQQTFIAATLDGLLPKAPKGYDMKTLEIGGEARYLAYLKPSEKSWNIFEHYAIGLKDWVQDKETKDKVERQAKLVFAKPIFLKWDTSKRVPVEPRTIDLAFLALDTSADLGKRGLLESALANIKRALKKRGRLYLVMNQDDEAAFGGRIDKGFAGSLLEKAGFQLVMAKMDEDYKVCVGYAQKKGVKAMTEKRKKGFNAERRPSTANLEDALGLDDDDE